MNFDESAIDMSTFNSEDDLIVLCVSEEKRIG